MLENQETDFCQKNEKLMWTHRELVTYIMEAKYL